MQPVLPVKKNNMTIEIVITLIAIGIAAGMLSGLVGVGGGIILVPAMVYFLKYSQHQAQGTSLGILTFPVVMFAFLQYYKFCKESGTPINFSYIIVIGLAFVAGSLAGSKLAIKIDQNVLRKVFAIILFYTAFKMLNWDKALFQFFKKIF